MNIEIHLPSKEIQNVPSGRFFGILIVRCQPKKRKEKGNQSMKSICDLLLMTELVQGTGLRVSYGENWDKGNVTMIAKCNAEGAVWRMRILEFEVSNNLF